MDRAEGTFFQDYYSFPGIEIPGYNMGRSYGATMLWRLAEP